MIGNVLISVGCVLLGATGMYFAGIYRGRRDAFDALDGVLKTIEIPTDAGSLEFAVSRARVATIRDIYNAMTGRYIQ